jgi:hypothetical protein
VRELLAYEVFYASGDCAKTAVPDRSRYENRTLQRGGVLLLTPSPSSILPADTSSPAR